MNYLEKCLWISLTVSILIAVQACGENAARQDMSESQTLFTALPASSTGIDFVNQLQYDETFNVYLYRNFYNGGGVAMGDINKDGLTDLYFSGNMTDNKLYLNKGNFQFEDITEQAGVACKGVWSTGVSFADVNGDGWLDIYVCKSGTPGGEHRNNELFINNGGEVPTFTEKSKEYNIADEGFSTHAAFFDYDKDGDLDCYLLNNSFRPIGKFDLRINQRNERDSLGGNKLYRNDGPPTAGGKGGGFTDVSEEANIYGSLIGFGLGVTIGDVNRDGWQDIYVSNDFFERDYLYINNQDGTFNESLEAQMREISAASMGADMADINNDGFPEVFVTDMLPEDDARMKTKTTFEDWNKYQSNVRYGYYHQFTRNVLQLNNGDNTFSEIGRMAGVYATDWSWGALIMDMDNDGLKDIFVANGIYQDLTDQDFIHYIADPRTVSKIVKKDGVNFKELIDAIPVEPIPNYAFHNNGDLTFSNKAKDWGLGTPSHSNGSAYGDLDNDGDLDLVINNVNMPPFVYRNNAERLLPDHHYLKFELIGEGNNLHALGTQISIRHGGKEYYTEHMPMRGFQSTMDYRPNIGLGGLKQVDTLLLTWPNGKQTLMTNVPTDQSLKFDIKDAVDPVFLKNKPEERQIFADATEQLKIDYTHKENFFKDFDRDLLIYHMLSAEGPKIAVADVNKDGRDDFYIGGAKDSPGKLFVQTASGSFNSTNEGLFEKDKGSEDIDCEFFDADGDGDMDLYVASGGSEFPSSAISLRDRLYLNNGRGTYTRSSQAFPTSKLESTACVKACDFDKDGDMDLFVGIRLMPFLYGVPVNSYLLENDGKGNFTNVSAQRAPALEKIGMITDAIWMDVDQDQDDDLVLAGDWNPVKILINEDGNFTDGTASAGLTASNGFWNCIKAADLDGDGDMDLVAGNHGRNTRFKASAEQPVSMHINDFDQNGRAEQVISVYNGNESYPLALRHDLVKQMPILNKKYLKYESYKNQTVEDIFTPEQLERAVKLEVFTTETSILINQGNGRFEMKKLPTLAQLSPTYGLLIRDFDDDGHTDILMAGNFHRAKPEVGIYDANYGLLLKGDGKLNFEPVSPAQSGFFTLGEVRDIAEINIRKQKMVLVAKNDDPMQVFNIQSH